MPGKHEARKAAGTEARRKPGKLSLIIPIVAIIIGLILLGAPIITDWLEAFNASQTISTVSATVDSMGAEERNELLAQARGYNAMLAGEGYDPASNGYSPAEPAPAPVESLRPYEEQLHSSHDPMMAWVEIPKIAVKEPLYHGVDDASLSAGVGHIERTSLPVGGLSSNCVVSAHSGVPTARMFDDLNKLEPGDTFTFWTLGEPYSYRVTGSVVVLPDEGSYFAIQPGKDMATLVTCTPYGVNSHRLLVFGERCEYVPAPEEPALQAYFNDRTIPFILAVTAIVAVGLIVLIVSRRRRRCA